MQIYAGLAIIIAVVASVAFSVLKPKEQAPLIMTMEDDFKAQADPKANEKNESDAYHKEIDRNGPYERKLNGTLTGEATIKLRKVINKRAYEKYKPRKQELMDKRLQFFQAGDGQNYV